MAPAPANRANTRSQNVYDNPPEVTRPPVRANVVGDLNRLVVRNALINVARLGANGVLSILLPALLVSELSKGEYAAWVLLLQLTLYVSYFDCGIQTAVAKFVAHAEELNDTEQRDGILSTAFAMLSVTAALACVLVFILARRLPHLFRQMPGNLLHPAEIALLLMGCSLALGLPASVVSAYFTGLQRNEISAGLAIGNKLLMTALVAFVAVKHYGLEGLAAALAIANVLTYAATYAVWKRWARSTLLRVFRVSKNCVRTISAYSGSLIIWLGGMLLVSGLDLVIVGIFDYKAAGYYAIAATLTNFVAQVQGAIFSALLPASAVLAARGDALRLGDMLNSATRYGMFILLAMALPLLTAGTNVLQMWVGKDYAAHSILILEVLLVANVIRLSALPYATLLLGTGQQGKVIVSPVAEGIVNLAVSIVGAYYFGAIGVAIGTLAGAFVSVGMHFLYNMPRTKLILVDRSILLKDGVLRPLVCVSPFALLFFVRPTGSSAQSVVGCGVTLLSMWAIWAHGLEISERKKVMDVIRHRVTSLGSA